MTFSNFTHEIHINPVSIIGFFRKIRLFHEKSKKMVKNTEKDENDLKKAKIAKKNQKFNMVHSSHQPTWFFFSKNLIF